jgi:hypothetical protein
MYEDPAKCNYYLQGVNIGGVFSKRIGERPKKKLAKSFAKV